MFSTLMVSFREGLEALLIVSITLNYLRATRRHALLPAVRVGVMTALSLCAALGIVLARTGGMSPIWEGGLAVIAAVCVISCTVHMLRHGRRMASEVRGALDNAAAQTGKGPALAVFAFVMLMVGREGVEAATMVASLARQNDMPHLLTGAVSGLLLAALISWLWNRYGRRVDLSLFFRVTSAFMLLFSVQLVIYAFHELTEASALPGLDNEYWHITTEPWGPEGAWGAWLSYGLVLVPLGFLLWGWTAGHREPPTQRA
jgi:high-affinity iron transporter